MNKNDYFLTYSLLGNGENGSERDNWANKVSGRRLDFSGTGDGIGAVVQLHNTAKWVVSSWCVRFN